MFEIHGTLKSGAVLQRQDKISAAAVGEFQPVAEVFHRDRAFCRRNGGTEDCRARGRSQRMPLSGVGRQRSPPAVQFKSAVVKQFCVFTGQQLGAAEQGGENQR